MLKKALEVLKKYYGYDSFREGQEKILESILQGKDTFAIMPTGAGKSLCFQIPGLLSEGITLVISPLISLMKDQVDSLNSLGISATFINSSLSNKEVNERITRARNGDYKLLYIAPERLESKSFCQLLESLDISLLAIDEAHCVSQWGHDFRTSYGAIAPLINGLTKRPIVAAFTATATDGVKQDAVKLLSLKSPNIYVTGFDRENLLFSVVRGANKKDFILKYVEDNKEKSGIIYAGTRKEVDNLYEVLRRRGYSVGKYHAGLSEQERTSSQEAFLYDDTRVMVATNAFGMGIDKSNVRFVLHYNMPKNMEAYYQEAGRAGRDGEPSECTLLFGGQDIILQKFLIEQTLLSPERKTNEYKKLQTMVDYCHTPRCLRKSILEYFGEENVSEECKNCSNCNQNIEETDITTQAQKIFSCIVRMKERFGISMVADVLKGSRNKKVIQFEFDRLPTYGIMKEYKLQEIKDIANLLIADDYLYLTEGEYPVVKLQQKATSVLKGQEKVMQKIIIREQKVSLDNSLFEILRNLRREISQREKVPPYIIFADSTLREMSEYCPVDSSSMLLIKGVGERKLQTYGIEFLDTIRKYVEEHGDTSRKEAVATPQKDETPSHIVTFNMYKSGSSIEEIANERNLKALTIQDHIVKCGLEGYEVDWDGIIPKKYESLILKIIKELGAEKLKTIKEALPEEVDYTAIKAVLCKYKLA